MAGERPTTFWPLFDLVVRTPRLELRLPREDEFPVLDRPRRRRDPRARDDAVLHPLDRASSRSQRARESAQWWWRQRAEWSPDKWSFTGAVFVDGRPVGVQDLQGEHFRAVRSVETGSWLGLAHQGQGLGREMREAVLHLAFAGLGAEEALSGAFEDNAASLATSRAVGYEENGEARGHRRDGSARTIRFRMGREAWERAPTRRHRDRGARGLPRHVRGAARLKPEPSGRRRRAPRSRRERRGGRLPRHGPAPRRRRAASPPRGRSGCPSSRGAGRSRRCPTCRRETRPRTRSRQSQSAAPPVRRRHAPSW